MTHTVDNRAGLDTEAGIGHSTTDIGDDDQHEYTVMHRMAAITVGRYSNRHGCSDPSGSSCAHPEHDRDKDSMRSCLQALGLPEAIVFPTSEERANLLSDIPRVLPIGTNTPRIR